MKRWLLYGGGALAAALIGLFCMLALQPVPPFRFMEGHEWSAAPVGEGKRRFVMTGQWLKVRQEAEKELLSLGYYSTLSAINIPNTYARKAPPSTPRAGRAIPAIVFPDVWLIPRPNESEDEFGEKPIRIEIGVSKDVAPRTTWDRLLALLKG
jgi:hypothetical protein